MFFGKFILFIPSILFRFYPCNMKLIGKFLLLILFFAAVQTTFAASWTRQNSNTLAWLRDVYFLNEQTGWIVGSSGTYLMTVDGGKSWTKEKNFTADTIRQVYFADAANGWLLCERDLYTLGGGAPSYLLRTDDGGTTWNRVEFTDNRRKRVTKIFFAKSGAGFAVGEGGALFAANDDQKIWKPMPSPARYLLFDAVFNDQAKAVTVGAGGSILFSEDGGSSWANAAVYGAAQAKLNRVFFINPKNGWTVGAGGKIFQTFNGGKVWREQKSTVAHDLTDVFFLDTAEGWAIGDKGTMLHTTTAGNVWTSCDLKIEHRLERLFFNGKKGFAVGFGGTILTYDEAGGNQIQQPPAPKLKARD